MGKVAVSGYNVADDSANNTAGPIKLGAVAVETDGTDPSSVSAEDDLAHLRCNRQRSLLVDICHPYHFHTSVAYAAGTTASALVAAPGAGLSLYLTDFFVSAQTTTNFKFREDTSTAIHLQFDILAGGREHQSFLTPLRFAANKPLQITTDATNTTINVAGYIAP